MIRNGNMIRLTSDDQEVFAPLNNGIPVKVRTVEEFNQFLDERIATLCPGDTPDEKFIRGVLNTYKIKD